MRIDSFAYTHTIIHGDKRYTLEEFTKYVEGLETEIEHLKKENDHYKNQNEGVIEAGIYRNREVAELKEENENLRRLKTGQLVPDKYKDMQRQIDEIREMLAKR